MSDREQDRLVLMAPAKINLYLGILGKLPNGYHELRSIVTPLELADTVHLERRDSGIEASFRNNLDGGIELVLARPEDNLAVRAALALQEATGCRAGAAIHIEKNIPVGGGLGGGSADAAAVLRGLNRLWGTGLSGDELGRIGARLGCDIPAMLAGRAVVMEGVGERVTPLDLPASGVDRRWWTVLANPGINVPTRDVYARYRHTLTPDPEIYTSSVSALIRGEVSLAAKSLHNGLEETVFRKYPLIAILVEALVEAGSMGALLCGSGSSVFGLADSEARARRIAAQVGGGLGMKVWTTVTRILPDGVMVAHGPLEP